VIQINLIDLNNHATFEKVNSDLDRVRSLLNQIGFKLVVDINWQSIVIET